MLEAVLEKLIQMTGLATGWIFLIEDRERYECIAEVQLPPALQVDNHAPMNCGTCWCVDRYADGRLNNAVNILSCRRLELAIERGQGDTCGITHHATVPLYAGDQRFGLLNVAAPGKSHFSEKELALLQSVALQIGSAISRIRLEESRRELIRMAERNSLARDLHDSVSQKLFSLSMTAKGLESLIDPHSAGDAVSAVKDMQHLAREALEEMRALIKQLRPTGLDGGLLPSLRRYGEGLGLNVTIHAHDMGKLSSSVEEALWRIGQEALNNVAKHARTKEADIQISKEKTHWRFTLTDRGMGLGQSASGNADSYGLQTMRERAELLGGEFRISSIKPSGTKVEVSIPRAEEG